MNKFWQEMYEIYGDFFCHGKIPYDSSTCPVAVRCEDIAKEIVRIAEEENSSITSIFTWLDAFLYLDSEEVLGRNFYLKPLERKRNLDEVVITSNFAKKVLLLFSKYNLSLAQIRGAVYEAILMIMNKPLYVPIKE